MISTRQKILDTAERLFAQRGYTATSMRQIISKAGVNLAAIHYHFGSKEELLDEIVQRRAGPVNTERLALLDAAKKAANGRPLRVEEILEALLRPMATVAAQNEQFVRFMGRLFGEGLMPHLAKKHFHEVMKKFTDALREVLPEVPEQEFLWRVHFMMGALAHTMCGAPDGSQLTGAPGGFHDRIDRLKRFLSAGFRAEGK
jgi:AcrR family transcriptional regulator